MKRLHLTVFGFRVTAYNPGGGWVAYIYDNAPGHQSFYPTPLMAITGLKDREDALIKIGAECRTLELNEVNPYTCFSGPTQNIEYQF